MEDLSKFGEPVSDLFQWPLAPDVQTRYRLTDEQVVFYEQNGYLSPVRILTAAQVDRLCDELAPLTDPSHPGHDLFYEFHTNESSEPGTTLFHALGAWRIAPGFHDLLWHPAFTVPASQLLGGPVRFWHDQLFCKPAAHGGVVSWHQDYSYWTRTKPIAHITCWIALDDSTCENGCVRYLPGSHHWDLLPVTGLAGDMDAIRSVLSDEQMAAFEHPVAVELRRGEASFHHSLMVHGSLANESPRPRRATVINAFRDGVRSASNDSLLAGVPAVPSGQPMGGRFFPLLCS